MILLPCPFCEGPPCLTAHRRNRAIFYGRKRYPANGLDLYAEVWCHECGAHGPHANGFVFSDEDVDALKREAAELWNQRDARHRDLYDGGNAEGLNQYPRAE